MNTRHIHSSMDAHIRKPILRLDSFGTGYPGRRVSSGLNIDIQPGEMVCLLGPNGCGKSTLMRSIAGLQSPLEGEIFIEDVNLKKLKIQHRAKMLSLVLTDKIEAANLTVGDIVAIGRHPYTNSLGQLTDADRQIIRRVLDQCNLGGFVNRLFAQLSDGEKQRVLIARALAQDTPLIMLDEPTAHLDLPNRIEMMKILRHLAKETKKAILLSTHELDLALQWSDSMWIMDAKGKMTTGAPEDLVLQGAFMRVFGNDSYFFDMMSGSFKMKHPRVGAVHLHGEGVTYEWTRRALEREGYTACNNQPADSTVKIVSDTEWSYSCGSTSHTCSSIRELLLYLRHESHFRDASLHSPEVENLKIKNLKVACAVV